MKVLVAGRAHDTPDNSRIIIGEVVWLGIVCHAGERGECDCAHWFTGLASGGVTTVAVVDERDITIADLGEDCHAAILRNDGVDDAENAHGVAEEIVAEAEPHPVGTRLRRDVDEIEVE